MPPRTPPGYPLALEDWWLLRAAGPFHRTDRKEILRACERPVIALSDGFTVQRTTAGAYASDLKAWLAYGLFYFPQTYLRLRYILEEVRERGFPAAAAPRVLDLGAGTGAATAAWLDAGGSSADLTLLDQSPVALSLARELLHEQRGVRPRTLNGDLREPPEGPWDVVLVSYAFNEALAGATEREQAAWLGRVARRLAPGGLLVICEPLIETAGPFLDRLRTAALGEAGLHIWAPCPHERACPLGGRSPGCHDVRNWRMPPGAQALNNKLGRQIQDLKFSFLALSPLAPPPAPGFRLIAPVHPTKGKWELAGCAPEGEGRRYEVLKRDVGEAERRRLGDLERGDRVVLSDLARAGDAWRGKLTGP